MVIRFLFKCCWILIGTWKYMTSPFYNWAPPTSNHWQHRQKHKCRNLWRNQTSLNFVGKLCVHVGTHHFLHIMKLIEKKVFRCFKICFKLKQAKTFGTYINNYSEFIQSYKGLLIMMPPCITTSSLLYLVIIIAYELTKWVCCVLVVASPGRGCHLFHLSACFKGGAPHCGWMPNKQQ